MLRKACRTRPSLSGTSVLVAGSMPRMPATNTKSPARVPSAHGPVGRIAPPGDRICTPPGEFSTIALPATDGLASARRHAGLQCERMQHTAHLPLERRVDELMLLDARLAAKAFRDHGRRIVVAIAGE